eukprot:3694135-Rhodomonas_salina.1
MVPHLRSIISILIFRPRAASHRIPVSLTLPFLSLEPSSIRCLAYPVRGSIIGRALLGGSFRTFLKAFFRWQAAVLRDEGAGGAGAVQRQPP